MQNLDAQTNAFAQQIETELRDGLVTFQNGKRYNADLSASYNIAARFFAKVLGVTLPIP